MYIPLCLNIIFTSTHKRNYHANVYVNAFACACVHICVRAYTHIHILKYTLLFMCISVAVILYHFLMGLSF